MAEMILRSRCALRLQDEKCCWTSTLAAWVTVSVRVGAAAREAALAELRAALRRCMIGAVVNGQGPG